MYFKLVICIASFFSQIIFINCIHGQEIITNTPFAIGESLQFKSEILNEVRTLNIYLPQSYHSDSIKNYPVIYLLDGSKDEDFIHITGLVQFATFPWVKMMTESIVVGIGNVDRQRDFTHSSKNIKDKEALPNSGGSARFINCLKEEIQPLIRAKYNTGETESIIGQSLGGLLTTEILFTEPQLFDNYIIISPSLWWDDQSLLNEANVTESKLPINIYLAVGNEGQIMESSSRALTQKLVDLENPKLKINFRYFESQNHGNILHLAVYDAFDQLFAQKEKSPPTISDEQSIKNLIINSFEEILSNHDSTKLGDYFTDDFLLLEHGIEWNIDTVKAYLRQANGNPTKTLRENEFEFIQLKIQGGMAWVAYQNRATFKVNGKIVRKMHWLESAVAVSTENGWRLQQLHSTVVKRE